MAQKYQQNHIICIKQREDPDVPKLDTLLSHTAPWGSVHKHHKKNQREGTTLLESKHQDQARVYANKMNTAPALVIQGADGA